MPEKTVFIDSKTEKNVSALGSKVHIQLNHPLDLTVYKKVRVVTATSYYVYPNCGPELNNNKVSFTYNSIVYIYEFPRSTLSLASFNETLSEYLLNSGLNRALLTFDGDSSSGKISCLITAASLPFSITWLSPDNTLLSKLFGFKNPGTTTTSTDTTYVVDSIERGKLNNVNSIYISLSCASGSVYNGKTGSNVIDSMFINKAPGHQLQHAPPVSTWNATNGGAINSFSITLEDDAGLELDLNDEPFTVKLEFSS